MDDFLCVLTFNYILLQNFTIIIRACMFLEG